MDRDELLRQLSGVEAACSAGGGSEGTLCLYRVVRGLSRDQWRGLKRELELEAWQSALPEELPAKLGHAWEQAAVSLLHQFLLCEMDRARHCQQPLALALLQPDDQAALDHVLELARAQLRSFDHAARLGEGQLAVVLAGTPLASAERQLAAMLRRIRQVCEPDFVCSAGLVGYGGLVEATPQVLLERAAESLAEARRLGGNRLEVAPSADALLASRETLVHAGEKHFLFTGKKLKD